MAQRNVPEMAPSAAAIVVLISFSLLLCNRHPHVSDEDLGRVYSRRIRGDEEEEMRVSAENVKYVTGGGLQSSYI